MSGSNPAIAGGIADATNPEAILKAMSMIAINDPPILVCCASECCKKGITLGIKDAWSHIQSKHQTDLTDILQGRNITQTGLSGLIRGYCRDRKFVQTFTDVGWTPGLKIQRLPDRVLILFLLCFVYTMNAMCLL